MPGATPATDGAPPISVQDDGDPGGDPDVGAGIGNEPPISDAPVSTLQPEDGPGDSAAQPEGWFTYNVCVLLKNARKAARVAFCNSQPESDVRARCFSHVYDSPVSWANWCYNEFRNE